MTPPTRILFVDEASDPSFDTFEYREEFRRRLRDAGYAGVFDHHEVNPIPPSKMAVAGAKSDGEHARLLAARIARRISDSAGSSLTIVARSFGALTTLQALLLLPPNFQVQHVYLFDPIPISADLIRAASARIKGRIHPFRTGTGPDLRLAYGSPDAGSMHGDPMPDWKFVRDAIAPLILMESD
jgi:hypothetical protein